MMSNTTRPDIRLFTDIEIAEHRNTDAVVVTVCAFSVACYGFRYLPDDAYYALMSASTIMFVLVMRHLMTNAPRYY